MSNGVSIEKLVINMFWREGEVKKILLGVFFLLILTCNLNVYAEMLDTQLTKMFNKGPFILPDTDELRQVQNAYQMELTSQPVNDSWTALSMERVCNNSFVHFQENIDNRTGRGFFVIRKGEEIQPWLLQAPHVKSDKYTGKLASLIFSEGEFKAAMWNSVSRKTKVSNSMEKVLADMTHLPNTYWQAITESFAHIYKNGKIIQLHGFSQSKRKSLVARESDVIISAGHQFPPLWVQEYAKCLKKQLPAKISLYPYDVKELGAMTNIQSQLLQNMNFNGFLHIELSKPMRIQLLKRKDFRQIFYSCL